MFTWMLDMRLGALGPALMLLVNASVALAEGDRFLPTGLRCPAENGGVLEYIAEMPKGSAFPRGARNRLKGFVEGNECRRIVLAHDNAGRSVVFIDNHDSILVAEYDSETRLVLSNAQSQCNILLDKVCSGSAEYRRRYYEMVEQNRRTLSKRPGEE